MAKKKTTQTQNQTQNTNFANTATYGQITPENTADIQAFRDYRPQTDQGLSSQYGNARNQLRSSFVNPLGGNYSAETRDKIMATRERQLGQDEAQAFRGGAYDANQMRAGQLGSLAALTQPRILQTGSQGSGSGTSSGTSNTTQGNNLFGDIMQIGQAGAGMAMM